MKILMRVARSLLGFVGAVVAMAAVAVIIWEGGQFAGYVYYGHWGGAAVRLALFLAAGAIFVLLVRRLMRRTSAGITAGPRSGRGNR